MHPLSFLLSSVTAALLATAPAFATDSAVDARIRKVETGLLPRAAFKKDLGRPVAIEQRMKELGIPGGS